MDISSLEILNFQSHAHTEVTFAPAGQLTVLVGESDAGKTACIRALKWLLFNQPDGIDFIRVGASMARVTVTLANGARITRERSKSVNRYLLDVPGQEEKKFEGFGRGAVPLEIIEACGIKMVSIGDLELNLNLGSQLEGPFLGSSVSAPVGVARQQNADSEIFH